VTLLARYLFDFERPESRRNALFILLAAAIISPDISMPSPIPAIRLEQIALAAFLFPLFAYYRRHPELRRAAFIDWAFLALGVAVAISLVLSPILVSQSHYSFRDPFELARVAEYWLMFRLAFSVAPTDGAFTGLTKILLVAAVVSCVISIVQYLGPPGFNSTVTSIWSDSHNYDGVVKRSRVVGFVGNPNYFGIFGGLLLAVSLSLVLLKAKLSPLMRNLTVAGVIASTACIVMSQSRTVALAVLGALVLGLCITIVVRRRQAAYWTTIGLFVLALAISVAFVEIFPPKFGGFNDRFSFTQITNDPSVTIRLTKWKSLFSGFFQDTADRCADPRLNSKETNNHEAGKPGGPAPAADVLARDKQRKADITAESTAVEKYSCDTGRWPTDDLAQALVPKYMASLPKDPKTGQPYRSYLEKSGFIVGADLENQSDPEGPVYALGSIPNIIVNPSLESTNQWQTAKSTDGRPTTTLTTTDKSLFGDHALDAEIGPTGSLYQFTVFDFPLDKPYTATVWVRSNAGAEQSVLLYMIGTLADGSVVDPMAKTQATLPGDGRWVPVTITFQTQPANRLSVLQTSVRAPIGQSANVTIDGVSVNLGTFGASFPYVEDVDPSRLRPSDIAGFSDSPFIGIGPQKDRQVGAFDNEYALMLDRYGGLGTLAYLTLIGAAFLTPLAGVRLGQRGRFAEQRIALSLGLVTYTIAQAAFNVAAGSYYSFQIMAIYWLLIGIIARSVSDTRHVAVPETEPALEPGADSAPATRPPPLAALGGVAPGTAHASTHE
jgi:O-Antigen ligase